MMKVRLVLLAMLVLVAPFAWPGSTGNQTESLYNLYEEILLAHTGRGEKNGLKARMVDYKALAEDQRWQKLLEQLAEFPLETLGSAQEKKAFYLNVYNILAMDMVAENWPLRSLRDLGSIIRPVWKHEAGVVGGEPVSLSYLEHDVLRATGDPRVHMAINCASMSCPDLRQEPYKVQNLDQQLDEQAARFLSLENKGISFDAETDVVRASSIFDWFEEDFESAGGIEVFIRKHRPDIPQSRPIKADLPYDWDVNALLSAKHLQTLRVDL